MNFKRVIFNLTILLSIIFAYEVFGQTTVPNILPQKLAPSTGIRNTVPIAPVPNAIPTKGEEVPLSEEIALLLTEEVKEYSAFQKYLLDKTSTSISREVEHFGYNFFNVPPETFTPVQSVPVNNAYVIGPGDEIRINIWGMVEGVWNLEVDRDGNITMPSIGTVSVVGLTYGNLESFLKKEISKFYRDFQLNVSLGQLRSIPVYLVGNVKKPGNYTVSSLSTLVNALFVSGGPSITGTMRDIHLKREGKTITSFDMYEFLLKGDKSKDIKLQPEDVIFVPSVGPLVAIIGNVVNPAIYEIREDSTISDLVSMAGGVSATGYIKRVQVERISQNESKIVIDSNLTGLDKSKDNIKLINGDVVIIYSISERLTNAITLKGNVVRPGIYQWREGIRVSDILADVEKDLLPETNLDYGMIERVRIPSYERELIFFNPKNAVLNKDKEEDKLLKPYDTIEIYSKWQYEEQPKVKIVGAVSSPGDYIYREEMKVSDLIKLAGGLRKYAYKQEAELARAVPNSTGVENFRYYIDLDKVMENDPAHNLTLLYDDYLFIRSIPDWQLYQTVSIGGEVRFPGSYTIRKGETITSIIARAGGLTEDAYIRGAVFTREEIRQTQRKQMDKMINQLELELLSPISTLGTLTSTDISKQEDELIKKQALVEKLKTIEPDGRIVISLATKPGEKMYDMELEDGDSLTIPKNPGVVSIMGAVYNPTTFVYGERIPYSKYLKMAGGFTPAANKRELYIIKVDGTIVKPGMGYILEPGDAIVAPEKIEIISVRREMKDIIDIMYKAAMVVAVTTKIF